MANLKNIIIEGNDWQNVGDLVTFEDNKAYTLQIQGGANIASSSGTPVGYFYINTSDLFNFTKREGEDLYIKSYNAVLSISD